MKDLYYLSDEQRMMRDLARKVARERIAPVAAEHDEAESYPGEIMKLLAEHGLFGIFIPEEYGGTGLGALAIALVAEEIAWACAATATNWGATPLGGYPILLAGSDEQKRRYLPRLATGAILAAYSLSEPGAGSDAASLQTIAARRGDRYVLNGSKLWCSNGSNAGVITMFATVDRTQGARGVTAFLVEPGFKGFSVGKKERKMGIRASPTVALHLEDCEVPWRIGSAPRARASGSPCAPSTTRAP
jgi:butyryl-CoA dehydrogenase